MISKPSAFATAGWAYGVLDMALAVSLLESEGIYVLQHGYFHATNAPHYATALGGVELRVPLSQVDLARELLAGAEIIRTRESLWMRSLVAAAVFFLNGLPAPPSGLYPVRSSAVLARQGT